MTDLGDSEVEDIIDESETDDDDDGEWDVPQELAVQVDI